ncbi:hypothetical protein M433DRAFT_131354 [Acidomyces richmondensis BFW]|nr:MAG: hypothetical protein FE78DRAFT_73345 [Acidomyces sp. 'richmondensis']KYG49343.1 hypothetical protein M433DRAFT_131354 [Acidomyces richmondensis BFW]
MEKLILRSVMYGADKIPEHWFDKIPGGFYKPKDPQAGSRGSNPSRPSTSGSQGSGRASRRRSTGARRDDDHYPDGGRRLRNGDGRKSYDGVDDDYYSGDDRRRRRNHSSTRRRRRRSVDDDRYGYDEDYGRDRGRAQGDDRRDGGRGQYGADQYGSPRPAKPYIPTSAVGGGGAAMAAGGAMPRGPPYPPSYPASPTTQSPPASAAAGGRKGSLATGYVPYAHLYGSSVTNQHAPPSQPFSPPPASSVGSVQPNSSNPTTPPVAPQRYQQNPNAQQQVPTGVAAAAGAGADGLTYAGQGGQAGQSPTTNAPYDERQYHAYDGGYGESAFTGYDENDRPSSPFPARRRPLRRQYSPSHDSYEDRRSRSERRADDKRAKSQGGRGKSRLREHFDLSQKGAGYGLIGAVAGGLAGNEVGKGILPTAIGAAVGAIGANAFQVRERYVPPGVVSSPAYPRPPITVDPCKPLNRQLRDVPPPPRRREAERYAQDHPDEMSGRRYSRRNGYYSD